MFESPLHASYTYSLDRARQCSVASVIRNVGLRNVRLASIRFYISGM